MTGPSAKLQSGSVRKQMQTTQTEGRRLSEWMIQPLPNPRFQHSRARAHGLACAAAACAFAAAAGVSDVDGEPPGSSHRRGCLHPGRPSRAGNLCARVVSGHAARVGAGAGGHAGAGGASAREKAGEGTEDGGDSHVVGGEMDGHRHRAAAGQAAGAV